MNGPSPEGWRRLSLEELPGNIHTLIDAGVLPPNLRAWEQEVEDGVLRVLRTVEDLGDGQWITHVSISHRGVDDRPGRYPTWDEQKAVVWHFAPGKRMVSIMPAQDEPYINAHETTFHWWEEAR